MSRVFANRKLLAGVGLVAALLLVALWPRAVEVEAGIVTSGPLRVTVEHEGKTRVHNRFVISAPVSGRLQRIVLEPGDAVKKGEVLATFRPGAPMPLDARSRAEAQARVESAKATVGRARAAEREAAARLDLASSEAQRQRALAADRIASIEALESAETAERAAEASLRAAEFDVRSAEHELAVAKARLIEATRAAAAGTTLDIQSPIEGVVLTRAQQSEADVPAGTPLLELGALDDLEIVADFLSTDAVKMSLGQPALIEQWGGDRPLNGRVTRVEPAGFLKVSALGVEEQRVNVIIALADPMDARKHLGDGYRVEARVVIWEQGNVLKVPTGALFRQQNSWAVYAVDRGRAHVQRVEIGRRNDQEAQVLSGVAEGVQVVLHPSETLSAGTRVRVQSVG